MPALMASRNWHHASMIAAGSGSVCRGKVALGSRSGIDSVAFSVQLRVGL